MLLTSKLAGMQKLLNVCSNYATEHSLSYNGNKSCLVVVCQRV